MFALALLAPLASVAVQTPGGQPPPPLPARAFTPHLIDPGLDGGYHRWFGQGELTPDGKLLIAFRNPEPPAPGLGSLYRTALTAAIVRPERLTENAYGHLERFFDPVPAPPAFGSAFTFNAPGEASMALIHYGYELVPCSGAECLSACRPAVTPAHLLGGFKLDPAYPLPFEFGNAHFTFALLPLVTGNPYRSTATGDASATDVYTTYKLWIVRTHASGYADGPDADSMPEIQCRMVAGELVEPEPAVINSAKSIFVSQTVKVVIHEASSTVVLAAVEGTYSLLTTIGGASIKGIEPSITEDGRLLVFHGNGVDPDFSPGDANVTYVFNPNPCSPTGWSAPHSITELPTAAEMAPFTDVTIKQRYKVFAQPIRMPPIGGTGPYAGGYTFSPGETVRGTYPWVSKDGSFFVASCVRATEAIERNQAGVCTNTLRIRAGGYACGSLTGGYIKYVDDVGVNPTRLGGLWRWPYYAPVPADPDDCPQLLQNSWRAFTFSTGIKPGPWEFLRGKGAPVPTQVASSRIPVMPMFEQEIDTYGEIRFEEADGDYLLYMACNEGLELDSTIPFEPPGEGDVDIDTDSTPDTSGRSTRARCTLNQGAAFPHEVFKDFPPAQRSAELRKAIGLALVPPGGPLHENVGFKGQAIVFNTDGKVDVRDAPGLSGKQRFTLQAFVKVLAAPTSTVTLLEYGGDSGGTLDPVVTLKLNAQGKFIGVVSLNTGSGRQTVQVSSRANAVPFGIRDDLYDPELGWKHVALTYQGDVGGSARVRIYLDGIMDTQGVVLASGPAWDPAGTDYYLVGPGRAGTSVVDRNNMQFVIDEVAVSDLLRTTAELRRDAYVVLEPVDFDVWPDAPAPDLPFGLDETQARWPAGLLYDQGKVDLGRDLFASTVLSDPATGRSCTTCHIPSARFADPDPDPLNPPDHARGFDVNGNPLPFNVPTLTNATFGTHKFFDGRAATIEEQVIDVILSAAEMGIPGPTPVAQSMPVVLGRVNAAFGSRFQAEFLAPADEDNLAQSIAMYIRTLNTGNAPFDTQVVSPSSMSTLARFGQGLFFGKAGCVACHNGTSFTDDDFHNIRSVRDAETIQGRIDDTGRPNDAGRIKTPTLRNVAQTGPYFHDGSLTSLPDVVNHYNTPFVPTDRIGTADLDLRPLGLNPSERAALVAFLQALTSPP